MLIGKELESSLFLSLVETNVTNWFFDLRFKFSAHITMEQTGFWTSVDFFFCLVISHFILLYFLVKGFWSLQWD